ncbi:MAG: nucleotidyltransferase family protein [Acidobacteriaceae bacterium]|jgi:molybdenum cofactor cytidylyltransferase
MTYSLSQKGISAIILAAGTSSRMGQAKQLLPLGSSTVLAQTIEHARAAGVDEVVLVLGSSAEPIRHQLSPSLLAGVKVVVNQSYQQGMASSLHAGLSALDPRSAATLIILGDQPFTLPQTLDQIIQAYRDSGAPIVIPTCQGTRGNPVLLDRSVFSEAMALEGDVGCRAIFGKHLEEIVNVEVEDRGILLDLDDREDYERLAKK